MVKLKKMISFVLIEVVILPVDAFVVNPLGIRRPLEEQPFVAFANVFAEREGVAHRNPSLLSFVGLV
jgi:hypothetical protein